MTQILVATLLTIVSFAHVAAADTTKQVNGVVKSDFPSQISVVDVKGQTQTYNYAPMGGPNEVELYYTDSGKLYVKVAGQGRSMCMPNNLGKLVTEIDINYVAEGSAESQSLVIPAGSPVSSTCPAGSRNMSDVSFELKAN